MIATNDPTTPLFEVPVILEPGFPDPPDIYVNPDEFLFEIGYEPVETQIMEIHNFGGEILDYSLSIQFLDCMDGYSPFPQTRPANFDAANNETSANAFAPINYTPTDDPFDLQFEYACADATGEAGIETDGTYIYTTLWNGTQFVKYDLFGNYIETFACGSAAAIRDLAYDGMYFYGGAATTTVFEMDFNSQTLISTISAPVATRAIAYDAGEDGFWSNNWSDSPTLWNRSGSTLNSFNINGDESFYGFAYMNNDLGIALFGNSQAGSGIVIKKYDLPSGDFVSDFDMMTILSLPISGDIGGGLFMHENIVPGSWTLGGLVQNVCLWGVEMGLTGDPLQWLSVDPTSGSVAGGEFDEVDVTGFYEYAGGNYCEAKIIVTSNDPDTPQVEVNISMLIEGIDDENYKDAYIMIYPNPAKDKINITSNYDFSKVTVINQVGQPIIMQEVVGSATAINTSHLQKGIYFVKVNSIAGESTHKLVIQ
jgi:hypothetical protein